MTYCFQLMLSHFQWKKTNHETSAGNWEADLYFITWGERGKDGNVTSISSSSSLSFSSLIQFTLWCNFHPNFPREERRRCYFWWGNCQLHVLIWGHGVKFLWKMKWKSLGKVGHKAKVWQVSHQWLQLCLTWHLKMKRSAHRDFLTARNDVSS